MKQRKVFKAVSFAMALCLLCCATACSKSGETASEAAATTATRPATVVTSSATSTTIPTTTTTTTTAATTKATTAAKPTTTTRQTAASTTLWDVEAFQQQVEKQANEALALYGPFMQENQDELLEFILYFCKKYQPICIKNNRDQFIYPYATDTLETEEDPVIRAFFEKYGDTIYGAALKLRTDNGEPYDTLQWAYLYLPGLGKILYIFDAEERQERIAIADENEYTENGLIFEYVVA